MKRLCHIRYFPKFFNAQAVWLQLRGVGRIEEELRNVAIAIDTRGRILRAVVDEARRNIGQLLVSIPDDQLERCSASASDQTVYGVLRDLDAFFFEALSLYELLERFYVSVLRRTGIEIGRQEPHESFGRLVAKTEHELSFNWRGYLEAHRNLFIHETAPYVAVEFAEEDLTQRALVVESETDVYLRADDLDKVLKGLDRLATLCKEDLGSKIGTRGN